MTHGESPTSSGRVFSIEPERARRLLAICETLPRTPLQPFIARLLEPDGHEWAIDALRRERPAAGVSGLEVVVSGAGGLRAADALKDAGKRLIDRAASDQDEPAAVLLYLMATAAALAHFGALISTRDPADLVDHFTETLERAPEAIRPTLLAAIDALSRPG